MTKFLISNVYSDICELSGKIQFKVVINAMSQVNNQYEYYNTYIFGYDSRLMLVDHSEFEINHPSEKKIINKLYNILSKSLCGYDNKHIVNFLCPICNNNTFVDSNHYCISMDCICNNIEKTLYEKINIIYGDIFDYELFKIYIYRNAIDLSLSKIDIFSIFHSLYYLNKKFMNSISKENQNKINRLLKSFFNMKISIFLKLCKCPFEYIDILDNIDINIPSLDNLYILLFGNQNNTFNKDIVSLFYMIEDKKILNYLSMTFNINYGFIDKYIRFKSYLNIYNPI